MDFINIFYILFFFGLIGVLLGSKTNFLKVLVNLEMLFLSINLILLYYSIYLDDIVAQVFVLYILTVAAGETAIGLSILVYYYRLFGNINLLFIKTLKG